VAALFKQFADYRSGKRLRSVMNAMAQALSVQDSAGVAVYFASRAGRFQAGRDQRAPPGRARPAANRYRPAPGTRKNQQPSI